MARYTRTYRRHAACRSRRKQHSQVENENAESITVAGPQGRPDREHVELLWNSALRHASLRQPQLAANQRMAVAMQELMTRLGREKSLSNSIKSPVRIAANDASRQAAAPGLVPA
ncbi:hypothetical protein ABC383_19915 [Noviherbaspirillum sp. 1P10PC]|uniref:hypothetical protein n=1 Tax=Noviherbaspirillum sp. 1P10PC TaxID=3132292 RepID=UPI0039A0172C